MLPGDADAAEHLDAVAGIDLGRLDADGGCDRDRDRQLRLVGVGDRAGGVGGGDGDLLGAQQHLGAHVLDRLEAADRLAELLAHLGVVGRRVEHPAGQPGGLGREHRRGQVDHPLVRQRQARRGRRRELDPRQRPGEVGGLERARRSPRRRSASTSQPLESPGGEHQQPVGQPPSTNSAVPVAVPPASKVMSRSARRRRCARPEASASSSFSSVIDEGGQRRRRDRAGHQRRGGLVDHRAQVLDAAACTTELLGDGDPEDPQLRKPVVDRRATLRRRPVRRRGPPRWRRSRRPSSCTSSRAANCSSVMVEDTAAIVRPPSAWARRRCFSLERVLMVTAIERQVDRHYEQDTSVSRGHGGGKSAASCVSFSPSAQHEGAARRMSGVITCQQLPTRVRGPIRPPAHAG